MHCFGCQYASPAQILFKNGKRKLKFLISSANFVFLYFYIRQIISFCKYFLKIPENVFFTITGVL